MNMNSVIGLDAGTAGKAPFAPSGSQEKSSKNSSFSEFMVSRESGVEAGNNASSSLPGEAVAESETGAAGKAGDSSTEQSAVSAGTQKTDVSEGSFEVSKPMAEEAEVFELETDTVPAGSASVPESAVAVSEPEAEEAEVLDQDAEIELSGNAPVETEENAWQEAVQTPGHDRPQTEAKAQGGLSETVELPPRAAAHVEDNSQTSLPGRKMAGNSVSEGSERNVSAGADSPETRENAEPSQLEKLKSNAQLAAGLDASGITGPKTRGEASQGERRSEFASAELASTKHSLAANADKTAASGGENTVQSESRATPEAASQAAGRMAVQPETSRKQPAEVKRSSTPEKLAGLGTDPVPAASSDRGSGVQQLNPLRGDVPPSSSLSSQGLTQATASGGLALANSTLVQGKTPPPNKVAVLGPSEGRLETHETGSGALVSRQLADSEIRMASVQAAPTAPPLAVSLPQPVAAAGITAAKVNAELSLAADETAATALSLFSEAPGLTQLLAEASIGAHGTHRPEAPRMIAAQLAEAFAAKGEQKVEVSLNPQELGQVKMRVITSETGITMIIQTERPETGDLMRRHIHELAEEFRRMGYEDISFEFSGGAAGGGGSDEGAGTGAGTSRAPADTGGQNTQPAESVTQNLRLGAAGVDMRV